MSDNTFDNTFFVVTYQPQDRSVSVWADFDYESATRRVFVEMLRLIDGVQDYLQPSKKELFADLVFSILCRDVETAMYLWFELTQTEFSISPITLPETGPNENLIDHYFYKEIGQHWIDQAKARQLAEK